MAMDISIKQLKKVLKKPKDVDNFLSSDIKIEEKLDGCLDKDTIIETKEFGFIPISKIVDENLKCSVRGYDTEKQELVWNEVQKVLNSGKADNWVEIELEDGRTIKITDNHWVWSETEKTYKQVKNLYEGEEFLIKDLKAIKIKKITKINNNSDRYDLELNGTKNFFANGILVHNTKLQMFLKPNAKGKGLDNWIVSYKGHILYSSEFEHNTPEESKTSIGSSQYRFIFDKLKNVDTDKLPKGYQFFCEYLIKKPTLMSNYTKLYNLILLSYGPSKCKEVNGKMICDNNEFGYDEKRPLYAKILGIDVPPVVFTGKLYPLDNLISGLKSNKIKEVIKSNIDLLQTDNKTDYLENVIKLFLQAESKYGGKPEGYVVNYEGNLYKFQQDYQLDKEARNKIKSLYKDTPENETLYWAQIKTLANQLIDKVKDFKDLKKALNSISKAINNLELPSHSKKNSATIKDDLMLTAKLEVLRKLTPETGLIIGKMRIFTKAHYQLIKDALKENQFVIVALSVARGKDKSFQYRKEFILDCFKKDADRLEIIGTSNGFIPTILGRAIFGMGVNKIYAGSDRIEGYKKQAAALSNQIDVIELKRKDDDVSATKVIENIDDENYFKENTPPCMWDKYEFIKENIKLFK